MFMVFSEKEEIFFLLFTCQCFLHHNQHRQTKHERRRRSVLGPIKVLMGPSSVIKRDKRCSLHSY